MRYIKISPRGVSNEYYIARGSKAACAAAVEIINGDPHASAEKVPFAEIVPCTHPGVRDALRDEPIYGVRVEALDESFVFLHRPVLIGDDGACYLGGSPLPA